jgi:hypothetical protein
VFADRRSCVNSQFMSPKTTYRFGSSGTNAQLRLSEWPLHSTALPRSPPLGLSRRRRHDGADARRGLDRAGTAWCLDCKWRCALKGSLDRRVACDAHLITVILNQLEILDAPALSKRACDPEVHRSDGRLTRCLRNAAPGCTARAGRAHDVARRSGALRRGGDCGALPCAALAARGKPARPPVYREGDP